MAINQIGHLAEMEKTLTFCPLKPRDWMCGKQVFLHTFVVLNITA